MANREFFKKIRHAQIESGGFQSLNKKLNRFVVLHGEYVGTWEFRAQGKVHWTPTLDAAIDMDPPRRGKCKWTALSKYRHDLLVNTIHKLAQTSIFNESGEWWARRGDAYLHILMEMTGTSAETMLNMLEEQPKRLLSVREITFPSSLKDRKTYCRVFLQTWSTKKATRACIPHVKGWDDMFNAIDPRVLREVLGRSNWKERLASDPSRTGDALRPGSLAQGWHQQALEFGLKNWHHLFDNYTLTEIERIRDTVSEYQLDLYRPELAESIEGRRFLLYVEEKNWKEILRAHDWFVAFCNTHRQEMTRRLQQAGQAQMEVDCIKWHSKAAEAKCPEGVTPLTTKEGMAAEGKELSHCVAGYWWNMRSHIYSFQLDGERATLEWRQKQNMQFRGVGNCIPSESMQSLLKKFIALNK